MLMIVGSVVVYDIFHPDKDKFELATYEVEVPVREVLVPPFLFEEHTTEGVDAILDDFSAEIKNNLLNKIEKESVSQTERQQKQENLPENSFAVPEKEYLNLSEAENPVETNMPASSAVAKKGTVMVAIVIDDMGVSIPHTRDILSLEKPVTASFLTYGAADRKQVQEAKNKGFEVMLHVPMMPHGNADLAPVTLSPQMNENEIKSKFADMLDRYKGMGLKGINNHMGSLFTEDEKSMGYIMQILKERKMFFLDSKTTAESVGKKVASEYGVPYVSRDVFLDNENDYDYIMGQLGKAEKIAHMRGYAVAIGHPKTQTFLALRSWMKDMNKRNIRIVRLGDLVREVNKKS